jgi:hypothetical protein
MVPTYCGADVPMSNANSFSGERAAANTGDGHPANQRKRRGITMGGCCASGWSAESTPGAGATRLYCVATPDGRKAIV